MKEMQERYKNDKTRLQREQMKLFKEAGVNPLGCLGPIFLQLPIFIALFYALRNVLADTPESLVNLSQNLYAGLPFGNGAAPIEQAFLGMELGALVSANPSGYAFSCPWWWKGARGSCRRPPRLPPSTRNSSPPSACCNG